MVAGDIDQATADEMARLLSAPPEAGPSGANDGEPDPDPEPPIDEAAAELVAEAEQILDRGR